MSDVFVAFVREDQAFAEAIAISLQDSGLQVSRSASVMEAIDQSPAVVVLWTQASSRSRLFLDAADRAFRSGKMVLARLGVAPTPAEYQAAPQHVFRTWSGDPDHAEVQVVVDHVQRQVAFARNRSAAAGGLAIGPGTVHPFPQPQAARPAPPPPHQPSHQQAPPPPQPAPPPHQSYDPNARMMEEANFWRQVQGSANPADFRAYLERYGPNGAFAELAGLRLQQLTGPPPQSPAPPVQPPLQPPVMQAPPMQAPPMQAPRPAPYPPQDPLPPYLKNRAPPGAPPGGQPGSQGGIQPGGQPMGAAPPAGGYAGQRSAPAGSRSASRGYGGLFDDTPPSRRDYDKPTPPPPKSGAMMGPFIFLVIIAGLAAGGWWFLNGGSFTPVRSERAPISDVSAPSGEGAMEEGPIDAPSMAPSPDASDTGASALRPKSVEDPPARAAPPEPAAQPRASQPPPARSQPAPRQQAQPAPRPQAQPARQATPPKDDPSKAAFVPPRQPTPEELARAERERLERERLEREIREATSGPPPQPMGPPR